MAVCLCVCVKLHACVFMCVCFSLGDELMKTEAVLVKCSPENLCVCL